MFLLPQFSVTILMCSLFLLLGLGDKVTAKELWFIYLRSAKCISLPQICKSQLLSWILLQILGSFNHRNKFWKKKKKTKQLINSGEKLYIHYSKHLIPTLPPPPALPPPRKNTFNSSSNCTFQSDLTTHNFDRWKEWQTNAPKYA